MKASTLKSTTCVQLIDHLNLDLPSFARMLDDPENNQEFFLKESCWDIPGFWRKLIDKTYGNVIILSRLDIKEDEIRDYALSLLDDTITRDYYIRGGFGHAGYQVIEGPHLGNGDDLPELEDDSRYITFSLNGIQPGHTFGYVVQFTFDDPIYILPSIPQAFICTSDHASQAECFRIMIRYLTEAFLVVFNQYVDGPVRLVGEWNSVKLFEQMPTLEQLDAVFYNELSDLETFNSNIALRYKEPIIVVIPPQGELFQPHILTMFIDCGQLRF